MQNLEIYVGFGAAGMVTLLVYIVLRTLFRLEWRFFCTVGVRRRWNACRLLEW
jgi:hypothetical protein